MTRWGPPGRPRTCRPPWKVIPPLPRPRRPGGAHLARLVVVPAVVVPAAVVEAVRGPVAGGVVGLVLAGFALVAAALLSL